MNHASCVDVCVAQLTVIVRPQVHCAGMVVGRTSTSCWGYSEHIRKILPEFGEQEDVVSRGVLDCFVHSWGSLVGHIWEDARLL